MVTSDTIEFNRDGTINAKRFGQAIIDNVEFFRFGQYQNVPAMRFEGASSEKSSLSNSVIYNGRHYGLEVINSM